MKFVCGGFGYLKNILITLNIVFVVVGLILTFIGLYARYLLAVQVPCVTALTLCGLVLILLAIVGIAGTIKHHQVLLFFYMIILFFVCIAQITYGFSSIFVSAEDQDDMAMQRWTKSDDIAREKLQLEFFCCTFDKMYNSYQDFWDLPSCPDLIRTICFDENNNVDYNWCSCRYKMQNALNVIFKLFGGSAVFFGFIELIGVVITVRYRNQKNPRTQTSAFL